MGRGGTGTGLSPVGRGLRAVREGGPVEAVRRAHIRLVRPRLPRRTRERLFNTVRVRPYRLFDGIVPWELPQDLGGHRNPEEYEWALVDGIRERASAGDSVVIVGGGLGVSSVVAARQVGPEGRVTTYEGAARAAELVVDTAELNGVGDRVSVVHGVVADAVRLTGELGDAARVDPVELPDCDLLVMDCEGAEVAVLRGMELRPEALVVETHGNLAEVRSILTDELPYVLVSETPSERPPYRRDCERGEVMGLVAVR